MEALIAAAGRGSRMGSLTEEVCKCMLEVEGESLIQRQVEALRREGVRDITVVTGYAAERLRRHLGAGIRYVHNEIFATTNSLYSFWLGLQHIEGELLVLNADVLFHPDLLRRLLSFPEPDAMLADLSDDDLGEEEMKVRVENGLLAEIERHLPGGGYDGENIGILKFGNEARGELMEVVEELLEEGNRRACIPLATGVLGRSRPIHVVPSDGLPWIEIDFPGDLKRARAVVFPEIPAPECGDVPAE